MFSTNVDNSQQDADQENGQLQQQQNMDDTNENNDSPQVVANAGSSLGLSSKDKQSAEAVRMDVPDWLPFVIAIAALVLLVVIYVARKLLRRRFMAKLKELPAAQQAAGLFMFCLIRFKKMGIEPPNNQTLQEYALAAEVPLRRFEGVEGTPKFSVLASVYSKIVYGSCEPSPEELEQFYDYYDSFYKRAVRFVGRIKYIPMFFRI